MYDISPEELKDYSAYTIVDIRDDMSYAYGHLPDAISVPQAELSTYIDEWHGCCLPCRNRWNRQIWILQRM